MSIASRFRRWLKNRADIFLGRCEVCGTTEEQRRIRVYDRPGSWSIGYQQIRCLRCYLRKGLQ